MNRSFLAGLGLGLLVAVLAAGIASTRARRAAAPAPKEALRPAPVIASDPAWEALRGENERLKKELAARPAVPPVPAAAPPPAADKAPNLEELIEDLGALAKDKGALAAPGDPEFAKMLAGFKKLGKDAVKKLGDLLLNGKTGDERGAAAFMLEQIGDAAAIPYLDQALRGDKDELVRRFCSHGLAFIRGDGAVPALLHAMKNDPEFGVRTNSAYGLAKMGNEEGVQGLVALYEAQETKDYRFAVLGALADVGHPSTAPMFRKILGESKEPGMQLASIAALEKMKDRDALPLLAAIIQGTASDSSKAAAKKAYNAIAGQQVYKD